MPAPGGQLSAALARSAAALLPRRSPHAAPPRRRAAKAAARLETLARAVAGGRGGDGESEPDPFPELPPPRDSRVHTAAYVSSAVDLAGCPPPRLPEFAFIGRSNVGKSSLINMLTGSGGLAQVSKTPGKTKCINHFLINDSWYLVDLPGYGYARRSLADRATWADFTQEFCVARESLASVFLLADASLPPQPADVDAAAWLAGAGVPFSVVLTKADKRKKRADAPPPEENVAALKAELLTVLDALPPLWATSAATGFGRKELLSYLSRLRQASAAGLATAGSDGGPPRGGAPDDAPDDDWF
jgi:GTP-binding protein